MRHFAVLGVKEDERGLTPTSSVDPKEPVDMTHTDPTAKDLTPDDLQAVEQLNAAYQRVRAELGKVIVGQDRVIEQMLMCILCGSHAILEGVPGLAKTLLVSSLARCMDLKFARIQFTPDLMPTDITGTEVIQEDKATGQRAFKFLPGPLFANVILADEINRTPPKTQAALLEAMQERQVSAGGQRHPMLQPFFVLATQNPVEQEGTYPLPEAQQDRFMFKVLVDYPQWDEEFDIIRRTTSDVFAEASAVLSGEQILAMQHLIRRVPVSDHVIEYAMRLVRATRVTRGDVPDFVKEYLSWGAGPRACQYLVLGGKARAVLHGRHHVATEDIAAVAAPVLRHRIVPNFTADAEGITPDVLIDRLLEAVPAHTGAVDADPQARAMLKA
jgi:MoxR-like ATPase